MPHLPRLPLGRLAISRSAPRRSTIRSPSGGRRSRPPGTRSFAAGGSITHHHGIGTDHREHYAREIGPLGVDALRAVKDALDPAGILNPGVLIA